MEWFSSISSTQLIFIAVFMVLYLLYILRVVRVARRLHTSYRNLVVKLVLRTSYFTLFIIALLGPSFGATSREIRSVGKDIMIAVDLSESMNAQDVQPSRLEKMKFELKNIVESFTSDRIGLIIFSSEAFVQCPLTYDQNALFLFIETLHTGLVPNTGTDFAPAINMSLDKLANNEGPSLQQKSKIMLLISDGEDFGEDTPTSVERIKQNDIRLFTLGIGTTRGSKIPTRSGYKINANGREVVTKLNPTSLKQLASATGGKYFEINESRNDISRLINTIGQIEGEIRDTRQMDVSANKYYYFLAAALLLILLDGLVSLKTIRI